jgi:outer membrane protein OmpA-like peptidoglycan-associated protein
MTDLLKKYLFLVMIAPLGVSGQSLLLNGGFEEENTCTEYKVNCAPEAWVSNAGVFFNYFKDANRAYAGEHCMSITVGHTKTPYKRTFLRSQLLCRMRKGSSYELTFFIKSPADVLDSMGVYFSPIDPFLERKPVHRLMPSLYLNSSNRFTKDSSWQKVTLRYMANGNENYFVIANYARSDTKGDPGLPLENNFYVFVDNFSLLPLDLREQLCDNWEEVGQAIYDQDERHEFLLKSIRFHKDDKEMLIPLSPVKSVRVDSLSLPDVFFATGKSALESGGLLYLDTMCRGLKGVEIDSLIIEGHTDNTGSAASNERLAMERASNVELYLKGCSYLSRKRIVTRGWGSKKPVAPNDTPAGRQQNRRVQLLLYIRE